MSVKWNDDLTIGIDIIDDQHMGCELTFTRGGPTTIVQLVNKPYRE